ncbi:PDZ and LIM domain protein 7 isoform X10 [Dermochelys coriacea]|uniref:PDZ and LIM domain protein 7 isoform X10 n=1 Tax=Dermochelys coriacea TaxID=27794 RepID=UPI001CA95352|nr:PDZ and LIM domain protein 7 isoform X10 [Dermochelys coriacea]
MSSMDSYKVMLDGPAPWGFRLQGGKDFNMPLSISRLTPSGKAAQAGVGVGDWVLSIDGENTRSMTHIEAQNKIRACGDQLSLSLSSAICFPAESSACWGSHPRCRTLTSQHSLRLMSPPVGLPNDSSKKRLIEDTEDWQPRTGTTQSRSFRILAQLTGTEFMQDPDDEHVRKASQVSGLDLSSVTMLKVEPDHGSAAPRAPAAPGPASRPPWAVDPSFAERYAPDKTSTVLSKHSQPAMPTPMQNRSSIVQAVQQPPEGTSKTPICYQCNKVIRGRYLVALGHYYHPEEFTCCQCRKVLDEGGFFEEKGSVFCPKCYDMRYAPSCAKCKKKIGGEIMHALKMTWHVQCFTCAACRTPIRNRAFYMEEGQPYCERGGCSGEARLSPLSPQTMRRCSAQNAVAATSRLMLVTGSWRHWDSAGTTPASSVRSARSAWKGRRSTPRRTNPSARAMPSPMCKGRLQLPHRTRWPCMHLCLPLLSCSMGPQGEGVGATPPFATFGLGSTLLWPTFRGKAEFAALLTLNGLSSVWTMCPLPLWWSQLGLQGDQALLGPPVPSFLYPQPDEPGTSPGGWTYPMLSPRVREACWSRAALTLRGDQPWCQLDLSSFPPPPPPPGHASWLEAVVWVRESCRDAPFPPYQGPWLSISLALLQAPRLAVQGALTSWAGHSYSP